MLKKLTIGVCYYPEHWDRSMWENDLDRMKEHGIEVVRIAEFAWSKFEETEGVFNFDFFDEFMELCARKGMKVIFCTPTATPPAWLSHKYPEILNRTQEGVLFVHGNRQHANLNSPKYLEFTEKIVTALAEHYGSHPNIVGWQIDNEINCGVSRYYSESDDAAFRKYMQEKFGTLENLNEKMGNTFWNQAYTDWEEVKLPREINGAEFNPHMVLEEKRFISHTACSYIRLQAGIIRKYAKNQFITTNGLFNNLDYHSLMEDALDFITYDNYPNFAYDCTYDYDSEGYNDRNTSYSLTLARSISNSYGIMEQQSGAGGWHTRMPQPMPEPGQLKLWALSSVALGADYVSFFRWRTCTYGTEIYWHGLNDYCNRDNRRLRELKETHAAFGKIGSVYGRNYKAKAAIVMDYDNNWDADFDLCHKLLNEPSIKAWQRSFEYKHIGYDFVFINDKSQENILDKYELAVYPHPSIITEERTAVLKHYAQQGGKLVLGARSGYKDIFGHAVMEQMPGLLTELCGARVEEYTMVSPKFKGITADIPGAVVETPNYNDVLEPTAAKVLGCFNSAYYKGSPAFTENTVGLGKVYYFGAGFTEAGAAAITDCLDIRPEYSELFSCSKFIQYAVREDESESYAFFLNFKDREESISLKGEFTDLISGETFTGETVLKPYQVAVFKLR